jgi:hypothetical protein
LTNETLQGSFQKLQDQHLTGLLPSLPTGERYTFHPEKTTKSLMILTDAGPTLFDAASKNCTLPVQQSTVAKAMNSPVYGINSV